MNITKFYLFLKKLISPKHETGHYSSGSWPEIVRNHALSRLTSAEGKLLDAGCGEGLFITQLKEINKKIVLIGVDTNTQRLAQCQQRCIQKSMNGITLVKSSITDMPFIDGEFEHVTFINTLFNLDSLKTATDALKEITRIMAKNGILYFEFRNRANPLINLKYAMAPYYDATIKAQKLPLVTYNKQSIEKLLDHCDLKIIRTTPLCFPRNKWSPIIFIEAKKC